VKNLFRALRSLLPLVQLPRWTAPVLLTLGLLSAMAEGASIALVFPLLQHLASHPVSGPGAWLLAPFDSLSAPWRAPAVGAAILGCVVVKNALTYTYASLFSWLNASLGHQLRSGVLRQLLTVSQSYLDQHDTGWLLNTLSHDTWRACAAFNAVASLVINACLVFIFTLILLSLSWPLTLGTALALYGISETVQYVTRRARRLGAEAQQANQHASQRMVEVLAGMRLIRAFGREAHEQELYEHASQEIRRTFYRMDRVSAIVGPVSETLAMVLLVALLLVSIRQPEHLATSITFLLLLYRLHPRIRQIDSDRVVLRTLMPALVELGAVMSRLDKPYQDSGTQRLTRLAHGVEFEAVTLRYDAEGREALAATSFFFPAGRTTALVGPSGAGKSSAVSLLCRFYDPTHGRILVDGVPLHELDLRWWREQLALVSQDVHLFNTTVWNNIAYGKLDANHDEVLTAARRAHALPFIEQMPDGFDTLLGDRGFRLSGGQRQRIALARALIRNPQILILDEAVNALDAISERLVHDAIETFGRNRTVIVIAHRLVTIERAEHVVVLDSGRVIECGPPGELRAAGGLFAEMHAVQSAALAPAGGSRPPFVP
jgi:subfamily B ATP-binding cassette protein MsbA